MEEARKIILCIEDDREIAALIAEELVDRGFDVRLAHDGGEGFNAIRRETPDLVLADINLPIMSGFEVLERVRAIMPALCDMPFVFVTAQSDPDNSRRGRQLGADEFVTKPIDFDVLTAVIATRLARRGLSERPARLPSNVKSG